MAEEEKQARCNSSCFDIRQVVEAFPESLALGDSFESDGSKIRVQFLEEKENGQNIAEFRYCRFLFDHVVTIDYRIIPRPNQEQQEDGGLKARVREILTQALFDNGQVDPDWSLQTLEDLLVVDINATDIERNADETSRRIDEIMEALAPLLRRGLSPSIQGLMAAGILSSWNDEDDSLLDSVVPSELVPFCIPFFIESLSRHNDVAMASVFHSLPFDPSILEQILYRLIDEHEAYGDDGASDGSPPPFLTQAPARFRQKKTLMGRLLREIEIQSDVLLPILDIHVPKDGTVQVTRTISSGRSNQLGIKIVGVGFVARRETIHSVTQVFDPTKQCQRLSIYFDIYYFRNKIVRLKPKDEFELKAHCENDSCQHYNGAPVTKPQNTNIRRELKEETSPGGL